MIKLDLNSKLQHHEKYDLIVSNPPYLSRDEANEIGENVNEFLLCIFVIWVITVIHFLLPRIQVFYAVQTNKSTVPEF